MDVAFKYAVNMQKSSMASQNTEKPGVLVCYIHSELNSRALDSVHAYISRVGDIT